MFRQIRIYTNVKLMDYRVNTHWLSIEDIFRNDLEGRLIFITGKFKSNNMAK